MSSPYQPVAIRPVFANRRLLRDLNCWLKVRSQEGRNRLSIDFDA